MDPSSASASGGDSSAGRRPAIDLNEIPPPPFPCDAPIPLLPTAVPRPIPPVPLFHAASLPLPLPPDPLALAIVCDVHANPTPAAGPPAVHPGEAGLTPLPCVLCGRPETRGGTVVCDGCERGFHVTCARFRPTQPHATLEDWLCCDCQESGRSTKRWTLGIARLLDINAPPPEAELEPDFARELPSSSNNPSTGTMARPRYIPTRSPIQGVEEMITAAVTKTKNELQQQMQQHMAELNRKLEEPRQSAFTKRVEIPSNTTVKQKTTQRLAPNFEELVLQRFGLRPYGVPDATSQALNDEELTLQRFGLRTYRSQDAASRGT